MIFSIWLGCKELSFIKCVSVSAALLAFAMDASALTFVTAPLDGSTTAIIVSGVFSPSENLSEFTSKVSSVGGKSIFVIFKSPGGNPSTAMRLGRLIRAMNLPVIQPREMQCESACALAFMGGSKRIAETGAIGVHKTSFSDSTAISVDDAVSFIQHQTAETISYMTEMGVDPGLLQLSLRYERDDMRYLSKSEMAQFRVTNADGSGATPSEPPRVAVVPAPQATTKALPSYRIADDDPRFQIPTAKVGALRVPKGKEFLRSGEDQASGKLISMHNGDRVEILAVGDRWYKVRAKGREGYLHHNWVKVDQFLTQPFENRYIQIKSFDNYPEAQVFVRNSGLPLTVYLATNKWYAVTLSRSLPVAEALALLNELKSQGAVPEDAFMTVGNTYVRSVCCTSE
ncbi:SH3 domain-containing protein [Agrobacterium tumefaciens]|uniref:SH3 domain-containing protein n=1 Tax=Agrobacterium tumefaciens TaxID=358 RepID=UPI003BA0E58D